ncbi:MAG: ATP-binding protein [Anaerolineales bacterium]|jgi:DNA helicase HerA-like ATPase
MEPNDLDAFLGRPPLGQVRRPLGMVLGGSLSKGLEVKLDPQTLIEGLAVGRYVVVEGETGQRFFGMITDLRLESSRPELANYLPSPEDVLTKQVYRGTVAYGIMHVTPMLVLGQGAGEPRPLKTIPAHFAPVYEAEEAEVNLVFGPQDRQHFPVGSPLEMDRVRVNLDLAKLVERSSGVFGKSGTGKSFITRILLAGVIRSGLASCLIFDMHNDYGWSVRDEAGREFKGLRQLFTDGRVSVITLDPETSRHRGSKVDGELRLSLQQIEPEDVELLAGLMDLTEIQVGALYYLHRKLGRDWIRKLLAEEESEELKELTESERLYPGTLGAIRRKFEFFNRLRFLQPGPLAEDLTEQIFARLNAGISVVLEFGTYESMLEAYILVANFLTRRIHKSYVLRKNLAAGGRAEEPRPLVIVIEEAHKFLHPQVAGHTIFGVIARELRKYNVTLLVVDQRPSAIEEEVMSQIGTRVTCLLDNEADIRAVFSGISGAAALREVLARLDTRQQALILGHAVPMPVVIRTREYDESLYAEIADPKALQLGEDKVKRSKRALYGE